MIKKFSMYMPQFDLERRIHMYLPDDYKKSLKRYPVFYMFDGHNLFLDSDATYHRSWHLGDQIEWLKKEMIVVGQECSHDGNQRLNEYSPFPFHSDGVDQDFEGLGTTTMDFFTRTLKPFIDANFPTIKDREHTWIGGSSCGGLMAYYAGICFSNVYSKAVCVSPYFYPTFSQLKQATEGYHILLDTRFYISWGAKEANEHMFIHETKECTELANILIRKGHKVFFNVKPDGRHCEQDWAKEVPTIMEFLYG